jgi:hypothetical protein
MVQLKDGSRVDDPRLDRLVHFDERSRNYSVARLELDEEIQQILWPLPRRLFVNQGQEGACVSAGFGHDTATLPIQTSQLTMPWLKEAVYWVTQYNDPWPGGAYPGAKPQYDGTSVLSGAQTMQGYGFFESYHWAFSIDQFVQSLQLGSNVLGLVWLDSMFDARPSGLLEVSGKVAGGHCVCCRGILVPGDPGFPRYLDDEKLQEPVAAIPQSWGLDYGQRGEVYIKLSDLEGLLKQDGECCVPVNRKRVNVNTLKIMEFPTS